LITVEQVVEILRILGCSEDPIYYRRLKDVTVEDLFSNLDSHFNAARVRLKYYDKKAKGYVSGTLKSMLLERLGITCESSRISKRRK
jgi:hypothetical protein